MGAKLGLASGSPSTRSQLRRCVCAHSLFLKWEKTQVREKRLSLKSVYVWARKRIGHWRWLLFNLFGCLCAPHAVKPALTVHWCVCVSVQEPAVCVCAPGHRCRSSCHRRCVAVQRVLGRANALGAWEGKICHAVLRSHVSACMSKEVDGFQPYENAF